MNNLKQSEYLYKYILQGIFAGEGSVTQSPRKSRRLRISQGKRSEFLEKLMDRFFSDYHFRQENRAYVITKKSNWDSANEINLAYMHPRKRRKFREIYSSFVEEHYPKGHLKKEVYDLLSEPWRTQELAAEFDRSQARLCDVLMELKKEGKIQDFKSGSFSYWIRKDENSVIISQKKKEYLELLDSNPLKVGKISDYFCVSKNTAYKHLKRLREMGLIEKEDNRWMKSRSDGEVIVL